MDFPDLLGCVTEGNTLSEAIQMAEDALEIYKFLANKPTFYSISFF